MMEEIEIRDVHDPESCRQLAKLFAESFGQPCGDVLTLMMSLEAGAYCVAAYAEGRLVGGAWCMRGQDDRGPFMQGTALAVAPAYQRSGIGQLLTQHCDRRLIADRVDRFYWTVDPLNIGRTIMGLKMFGDKNPGAFSDCYKRDCYGPLPGALSEGGTKEIIPSDRIKLTRYPRGWDHPPWSRAIEVPVPRIGGAGGLSASEAIEYMRREFEPQLNERGGCLIDIVHRDTKPSYKIAFV